VVRGCLGTSKRKMTVLDELQEGDKWVTPMEIGPPLIFLEILFKVVGGNATTVVAPPLEDTPAAVDSVGVDVPFLSLDLSG
jgi:hypothetical protein